MNARANILPVLGIGLLLLVVGLAGWAIWSADPSIDRSVIGTAGLAVAVDDVERVDRPVREREGRDLPGLRILPLYDTNLVVDESNFTQSRDLRQELRQTDFATVRSKLRRAPTLVVLPKWRLGALAQSVFHPTYLVDAQTLQVPFAGSVRVAQGEPVYETFSLAGRLRNEVTLYAAQTLRLTASGACTPVVWRGSDRLRAVLVARCRMGQTTFHVLSDPDLVNNHGLGVGSNVAFARDLVASLAGSGPTVLDLYGGTTYPRATRRDDRGRSLTDVLRLLGGPFALVWMALALLAALALWRGAVRFGRAEATPDNFLDASLGSMIAADARVLRAGGAAEPLLARHGEERLAAMARAAFGRSADTQTWLAALARRAPERAATLRDLMDEVSGPFTGSSPVQPKAWLARFEQALAGAKGDLH